MCMRGTNTRLMQARVTQYRIKIFHPVCCFSPYTDQPHAVIKIQQFLVVELVVYGYIGKEIAGVSK